VQKGLYFPRRGVPLHSMVTSCGYSRETAASYDWDGIRRGSAEFVLLQYTLDGAGRLRYEGADYTIGPGQAMLLHFPHHNRYYLPPDSPHWEFIYVCLCGAECTRLWREVERRSGPVVTLAPDDPVVVHTAQTVASAAEGAIRTAFRASSMAYGLSMALAERFLGQSSDGDLPESVVRAMRFAREHTDQAITVDDMADHAGYSRFHFSRLFVRKTGQWPGEFLRDLRLRKAVSLLQTSELSVKETAAQCGFYDATYFCKVFRKAMGMTPREYRLSGMYAGPRSE
jgi:AraC family transcriptional regulator